MLKLLAFDYGASSGRAILGEFNGDILRIEEIHRFSNEPVMLKGRFQWDILRLFHEMKQGLLKCVKGSGHEISSLGIDTWGVDFGLLGPSGELLENPYHYRDSRTDGMLEEAACRIPKRDIYDYTGIQFMKLNTLYQLLSMKLSNSPALEKADTLLFTPDLLSYFLTGEKVSEFTIASTSQMYDPKRGDWARDLLSGLSIPDNILTDVIKPCTVIGKTGSWIKDELNIGDITVTAVGEHDTASAVASVPAVDGDFAYLSSGTWSLLGVETKQPIINDTTYSLNYTNEGGVENTFRVLKNIMGLWIYQECKRTWDKEGSVSSFDELEEMASKARPFVSFINPDDDVFYTPGDMPRKIAEYCRRTGQEIPCDKGATVRCIMESLALKYRFAVEGLESIVGHELPAIHIVGGGCKNTMLCMFTANAAGRPVIAGPVEATAIGNLVCQLIASGRVSNIQEARSVVKRSFPTVEYLPRDRETWEDAYGRFLKLTSAR